MYFSLLIASPASMSSPPLFRVSSEFLKTLGWNTSVIFNNLTDFTDPCFTVCICETASSQNKLNGCQELLARLDLFERDCNVSKEFYEYITDIFGPRDALRSMQSADRSALADKRRALSTALIFSYRLIDIRKWVLDENISAVHFQGQGGGQATSSNPPSVRIRLFNIVAVTHVSFPKVVTPNKQLETLGSGRSCCSC